MYSTISELNKLVNKITIYRLFGDEGDIPPFVSCGIEAK